MKKNLWGTGKQCYVANAQAVVHPATPVFGPIVVDIIDTLAVQLITTGTLAGTWTAKASNDYMPSPASENGLNGQNPGNFSSYTGFTFAAVSSGGSSQIVEKGDIGVRAIEFIFTTSGGTGTASVIVFGKGQG